MLKEIILKEKGRIITLMLILLMVGLISYIIFNNQNQNFQSLNPQAMYNKIIEERNYAIGKAVMAGDYRCCINPPCTMCYMEANKWNNFTAGTCACDDLIAKDEEPCPQCERGLDNIHDENNTYCDINANANKCDSNNN